MYLLNNGWIEKMDKIALPHNPSRNMRLYWLKPRWNKCDKRLCLEKELKKAVILKHLRLEWLSPTERI